MTSRCFLSIVLLLCVAMATNGFTAVVNPNHCRHSMTSTTTLSMKFMKDLGFEKPSWLPDFGGAKKEDDDASKADDAAAKTEEKAESESEPVTAKEE